MKIKSGQKHEQGVPQKDPGPLSPARSHGPKGGLEGIDTFNAGGGGAPAPGAIGDMTLTHLRAIGERYGVPRYLITNMHLLRGDFLSETGESWSPPELPHARVYDLVSKGMPECLERALSDPTQFIELPPEESLARLRKLSESLKATPDATSVLVEASLLKYIYGIARSGSGVVNIAGTSVAFIDSGVRPFHPYEFASSSADLPIVMKTPKAELEQLQTLARESTRWHNLEAQAGSGEPSLDFQMMNNSDNPNSLWVMQVVSNQSGGRHPWLRLVSPDGAVRVVGFGYMDRKPGLGQLLATMGKGRFAALDPNERVRNIKKVTTLPLSSREGRQVIDSVLGYQQRLLDATHSSQSGPAYQLLQQNCAVFVLGILAEVLDIHLSEPRPELHRRVTRPLGTRILSALREGALFPFKVVAGCFLLIVYGLGLLFGAARGEAGERFRHSPLQLNRDEVIPQSQQDWTASLRPISVQPPMLETILDLFRLGATRRVVQPLTLQRWQNAQLATETFESPGYLALVDPQRLDEGSDRPERLLPLDGVIPPG